ncbi:protein trichome birefringence-like 18 [Phtheirospermum japonicum]|uniref:Protein trichome birefringence-like 18 n=1 Tax=Phtheirospermum japonicum TaxID=374723 RepID=A0A830BN71_9LAMI|nr:protein trichome birefringence-like 18 [Phtheirospermum japonicum]
MNPVSIKEWNKTGYPKALLSIVASVGGLALFLLLASTFLVSQPIGYTVRGYFYGVDSSRKVDSSNIVVPYEDRGKSNLSVPSDHENEVISTKSAESGEIENNRSPESQEKNETSDIESENSKDKVPELKVTREEDDNRSLSLNDAGFSKNAPDNLQTEVTEMVESTNNLSRANVVDSDCDLSHGKWIHDSTGPLYTNNSCPVITQMQNCQGNGRPDKDYENWRWKPTQCDVPRFDPKKFLELMRGKTLAFIGDSVARNQMESMLCILWQVEAPKNRGNKKMQRYYFRSTSTMIVRIWSSWLVHQSSGPLDFAPAGVVKLHLDKPDEVFMEYITGFDVIVLSSGHWFAKQSAYVLNNEIVGGQLWWPDNTRKQKINNIEAFGVSVESILTAMGTHPNYTGLTIVRSFSPDHYEGGAWNTGGSCTGKVRPALDSELVENGFTNIMLEKQVTGFNRALEKKTNKSKLKLLDITEAFSYRHDGHPGPYRSPDPNKVTKRGPDGRPPPQDCLHWCMPGPVDTWNELVFEIIRREFRERQDSSVES